MAQVETVRGPVDVAELGPTLMHEHVVNITPEFDRDYPHLSWPQGRDAVLESAVTQLQAVCDRGIRTILDATAFGHGRDVAFLQRVNERVDINIITCTGMYVKDDSNSALVPPIFFRGGMKRDIMIEMFLHDINVGVAGTGVKAAAIKCATDASGVTPVVERILRACAVAHRETGVPITTHTASHLRNGLDQQRIFAEEGVDLSRVIIGHSGDSMDLEYLREIMDQGSIIGADRFGLYIPGFPTMDERVDTIAKLCAEGYADRIILSHDYTIHVDWYDDDTPEFLAGFPPAGWVPTHISDDVLPAMRERGVTEEQITAMMVGNPRRVFEVQGAY